MFIATFNTLVIIHSVERVALWEAPEHGVDDLQNNSNMYAVSLENALLADPQRAVIQQSNLVKCDALNPLLLLRGLLLLSVCHLCVPMLKGEGKRKDCF